MKRRAAIIRPGGALFWSTTALLATAGLTGCQKEYVATEKDKHMAETQLRIEKLDSERTRLSSGLVANNFHLEGVGYYHAEAHAFFQHPYNFEHAGRWYVDGTWAAAPGPRDVPDSRPTPAALQQVQAALEKEQQLLAGQNGSARSGNGGGGFGMGNMLLMYWMLSGNRGAFSPGAGFQQANRNAPQWQNSMEQQRQAVRSHAAANPGYNRLVSQARASGQPLRPGSSVRGGFGSNRQGGGFSSGS